MRYLDEYRDPRAVRRLARAIVASASRRWRIMEVCGGQTHAIVRFGIDRLVEPAVELVHGPGCPVCVTPAELIDAAIALAARPGVVLCSFGDMLRVPGSAGSLLGARAQGAQVRVVYSPLDAVAIAEREPESEVVFFAVGFETTAPANAMAVLEANRRGLGNFSLLVAHVLAPPAMEAVVADPASRIDGFLAAGHVCTITGTADYEPLVRRYRVPIVVTGFEPLDLLGGLHRCVLQLEAGRAEVEIAYARSVREEGNRAAQAVVREVFEVSDRSWRGMGTIPLSGLALRAPYAAFDALARFGLEPRTAAREPQASACRAGEVLQGRIRPDACPAFGSRCTPEHPLGAPMVSSEGACAAWWRYRRGAAGRRREQEAQR